MVWKYVSMRLRRTAHRRICLVLNEDRHLKLVGHVVDEALHHRALRPEVVGGQAAAEAGAFADVGQGHPGRADLADQLRGRAEQSLLGFVAPLLLGSAAWRVGHGLFPVGMRDLWSGISAHRWKYSTNREGSGECRASGQ